MKKEEIQHEEVKPIIPQQPPLQQAPAEEGKPAGGWAEMFNDADGSAEEEFAVPIDWGTSPAPKVEEGTTTGGLPVDADGSLPFFFIDAYENMDGRPGECSGDRGGDR